jgi:hypothetical protein
VVESQEELLPFDIPLRRIRQHAFDRSFMRALSALGDKRSTGNFVERFEIKIPMAMGRLQILRIFAGFSLSPGS